MSYPSTTTEFGTKLAAFCELLEKQQEHVLQRDHPGCKNSREVWTFPGKKYIKVDVGTSGKFMVERGSGNIYGIKGYGQINKKKHYGTLDTIEEWYWGEYDPYRKEAVK